MRVSMKVFRAAIVCAAAGTAAALATADSAQGPTLSPELVQELANGGTKGVLSECFFNTQFNCRPPANRVNPPAAPAPVQPAATARPARPAAAEKPAVQTVQMTEYTGVRFGWRHADGKPTAKDHRFKTNDLVSLWVEVSEPGYLYVVNVDSKNVPTVLWPRPGDSAFVSAGRATVSAQFVGETGVERVYAIVAPRRLQPPETYALHAHRQMAPTSASEMNIQYAMLDLDGRLGDSGIAVSREGRVATKGLFAVGTNFEARQGSSVMADPGGVAIVERRVVERFPVQVLSLDLIHVSR